MRKKASTTARLVAIGRAMADLGMSHVPNFSDPTARTFLAEKGKKALAKTEQAFREPKPSYRKEAARVMADLMALRTSAIDAAVRTAITQGATQLVILGAGFDGRAWRMPELAGVRVFEVDHPATQTDKRERVKELPPALADVAFVSIDFEREKLDATLERAGHESAKPTCWIWEGVVMYLTHETMRATLADVGARSAKGSTMVVNYHTVRRGWIAQLIFRLIGEPQISSWTEAEMAADLRAAGFTVSDDSGMTDWNLRFAAGSAKVQRGFYMRVAVAEASDN